MAVLPVTINVGTLTGDLGTLETTPPSGLSSLPITGTLSFQAAPTYFVDVSAKKIFFPKPFSIDLVGGKFTVDVLATDEEDLMPIAWTWKISFALTGVSIGPMNVAVPGGSTQDLTQVIALASSGGVMITKGEKGDPGGGGGTLSRRDTPWGAERAMSFLREQMLPVSTTPYANVITMDRLYPSDYTGPVSGSFALPAAMTVPATSPGTYITISDPGDLLPTFRGVVYGKVEGIASPATYRVQAGKIDSGFNALGSLATPDAGGFFAIDLSAVETWRKGEWAFRLGTAAAPTVAVGGYWPSGPAYVGLAVELHATSDDDYLISSMRAPASGKVTFWTSTPGVKSLVLRDTGTSQALATTPLAPANIRSYVVSPGQPGYGTRFVEQCYVYDQALALMAAVAVGDEQLASSLLTGLLALQTTTGAQAGGFRFSGRQLSPAYGDPAYRTGAHALAVHAALAYARAYPQTGATARAGATAGLSWMSTQLASSGNRAGLYLGGMGTYTSGVAGAQVFNQSYTLTWASTEHNIDAYFALKLAGLVLGGSYSTQADTLASVMWTKLWNAGAARLNQGLQSDGPDTADPLDIHGWGSIWLAATGHTSEAVATMTDAALAPYKVTVTTPNGRAATGYSTAYASTGYPGMGPHLWWEGTFSVAYAMVKLGQYDRASTTIEEASTAQFADGSFPYVTPPVPSYELNEFKSVASVAWAILATVGGGVFDMGDIPPGWTSSAAGAPGPTGPAGPSGLNSIYQNADGSWPTRTSILAGLDRTRTIEWVGTAPGPVIGIGIGQAVALIDRHSVTSVIPA